MTKVAAIQWNPGSGGMEQLIQLIATAAEAGADFALLPELTTCPWIPATEEPDQRSLAEDDDGPAIRALCAAARQHRLNLIAPLYERSGESYYSTAYVIDRSGQVVGKYRKNHVPYEPGWYETFYYGVGDSGFPVFELDGLRFGVQICWDNHFPEGSRILALKGADVIFSPRATGVGSLNRWRKLLTANAVLNRLYIVNANRVGPDRGVVMGGGSIIIDPTGEPVTEAGSEDQPQILLAEIDQRVIERARRPGPHFENRRPEIYLDLTRR